MTQARTVVYVAADAETAREGSDRLENADSALEVVPVVGLEELRDRASVVDCVIFAETPTTAAGANLLEVIDASRETPVVLFTDSEYGATTARSTEGVDGYVRRDADGAFDHLTDEIAWVCHGDDDARALPGATDESDEVLAGLPEGIFVVDVTGRITYANEWLGEFLGVDANELQGVTLESLAGTGTLSGPDAEAVEDAVQAVLSGDETVSEFPVEITTDEGVRETTDEGVREASLRVAADGDVATVSVRPIDEVGSGPSDDPSSGIEESAVAAQLAAALERIGTAHRLRDREERLTRLATVAEEVAAADGIEDAADRAAGAVRAVLEADGVALLLAGGADAGWPSTAGTEIDELVPVAREGSLADAGTGLESTGIEPTGVSGAVAEAYRSGEFAVLEGDETASERFDAVAAAPVGDRGVLQAVTSEVDGFDDADRLSIELLSVVLGETIARLRTGSAFAAALERLDTVFETLPDPAVRYEIESGRAVVREVNPAFADAFGFDRASVAGRRLEELVSPVDGETRDPIDVLTRPGSDRVRTRRRIGGETRDVQLTVVPLESDVGIVEGAAIYTDVTAQVRRERELEARSERLDEFASIVGQDLRSPLNVARGYLELAEATGDAEHFAEIESAHERIDALVGQLLSLLRVDDLDVESETDAVSLHDVARAAWGEVDGGSATLALEDDVGFLADRELVTELLWNLLANCVDHGADGDDSVAVRVGPTDRGFYVADDGVGIDPDERDAVLESGYTTDEERTGYGLTVVERIARAHEWTIDIDESDSGGTRVIVEGVDLVTAEGDGAGAGGEDSAGTDPTGERDGDGPTDQRDGPTDESDLEPEPSADA